MDVILKLYHFSIKIEQILHQVRAILTTVHQKQLIKKNSNVNKISIKQNLSLKFAQISTLSEKIVDERKNN